ncbi:MAG: hypothetical protein GEU98_28780 [Pseudonocardiaceae bacterium]|nr:hypothetical protein [Pseudonocardiaceae bacterium]
MPTNASVLFQGSTIAIYLLVTFAPGLLAGFAAGLRGWVLAGLAPILTFTIAGLAGPWLSTMGLRFTAGSFAICTALVAVLCAALHFGTRYLLSLRGYRRPPWPTPWTTPGHLAAGGCLALAAGVGMYTVLTGLGKLNAIPQGFDAVMHGNGIRYIADTGDGGLFGMATINWYGEGGSFYPNGYHLVGALVYELSGGSVPAVINANTVLIPGLLALSLVTLIRQFRGRAMLACFAPLIAVASTSATYESMYRGPLLPFVLGLALTPLAAVAMQRYLQRPGGDTGFVFAASMAGLLAVHSSALFGGMLFCVPLLVQRWVMPGECGVRFGRWRRFGRELLLLLPVTALGAGLAWPHLSGALALAGGDYPYSGWTAEYNAGQAWWRLVSFQHVWDHPQWVLFVVLVLGLAGFWRLGALRWLVGSALLFGEFFVLVASDDGGWVMDLARPWWDDRFRLIALACVPMSVIAGHGIAELQYWLSAPVRALRAVAARERRGIAVHGVFGAGLVVTLLLTTGWLYTDEHSTSLKPAYQGRPGEDMPVSPDEARAMLVLGNLVKPGEWVLNDRPDGSAWMYAIAGVRPISGHYDGSMPPDDQRVLSQRFNEYQTDPEVRRIVAKRNIRYIMLNTGKIPATFVRSPGLTGMYRQPYVEEIYRNRDSVIYRLIPEPGQLMRR